MTSGAELRDATEELNGLLQQAEADIVRMNLGVEAVVSMRADPKGDERFLTFAKSEAKWGIFVMRPVGDVVPLLRSSRAERILAASHLDMLEAQIRLNACRLAEDLKAAIAAVRMRVISAATPEKAEG